MAVFESGLFSRLSGSFGNVTMYRLGDSNVVKGKRWARDARTPLQLIHRAKWKVLGLLAMRMKKVLELGFPGREARGRVNGFMSRNLPCMTCDEGLNVSVDYSFGRRATGSGSHCPMGRFGRNFDLQTKTATAETSDVR